MQNVRSHSGPPLDYRVQTLMVQAQNLTIAVGNNFEFEAETSSSTPERSTSELEVSCSELGMSSILLEVLGSKGEVSSPDNERWRWE